MSERHGRTERDRRRRALGQNFLVDHDLIRELIDGMGPLEGALVLDIGAGPGALTLELARRGADVWAVEPDPVWLDRLRRDVSVRGLGDRVRLLGTTAERLRFPRSPYRVVANPPFGITTALLGRLLDRPEDGLTRIDLVVQREVARKHTTVPPVALRTAGWLPWWEFHLGRTIHRSAFRPRPTVDAAVLTIVPRDPPLLPHRLAPAYAGALRAAWDDAAAPSRRPRSAR